MNILEKICADKKTHVETRKQIISIDELKSQKNTFKQSRGFIDSINNKASTALIAEVKKASPSKGIIRENFDPVEIAKIYEESGAACISVLTDEPYFQGKDQYLVQVKENTTIPLLRKDFMVDEYQIWESKLLGADCILLIMAGLEFDEVKKLYELASELDMDTLFEVHDEHELEQCLKLNPQMVGVNSRNLKTLEVSIDTTKNLAKIIPDNIVKVAESGLKTNEDIDMLYKLGYKAFLIGESLTKQDDISSALKKIMNYTWHKSWTKLEQT